MSVSRLVINPKQLPTKPLSGIWTPAIIWLFLDRFGAPALVMGIFYALAALVIIGTFVVSLQERSGQVEIREAK
jgi:hypothetical protein